MRIVLALIFALLALQSPSSRQPSQQKLPSDFERYSKLLLADWGDPEGRREAVGKLAQINTPEAAWVLLTVLEHNLESKQGNTAGWECVREGDEYVARIKPAENVLLMDALVQLRAAEALPLFEKMRSMDLVEQGTKLRLEIDLKFLRDYERRGETRHTRKP
jgi:HEAT repeat protein